MNSKKTQLSSKHPQISPVIWLLTLSDTFTWGTYTILSGLSGLYISSRLGEHSINVIGTTVAIFFLTRAFTQIPIGLILDKIKSDKDEITVLALGSVLAGLPFVIYPMVSKAEHFYMLHALFGLGVSLNLNAWRKLFAKNLEKGSEGLNYGTYETIMSFGSALFGYLAGIIANTSSQNFNWVISGSGLVIMLGSIWSSSIFFIKDRRSKKL